MLRTQITVLALLTCVAPASSSEAPIAIVHGQIIDGNEVHRFWMGLCSSRTARSSA